MPARSYLDEDEPVNGNFWRTYIQDSLHVFIPVLLAGVITLYGFYPPPDPSNLNQICRKDYIKNDNVCFPKCEHGSFALPGMDSCRQWLSCDEIENEIHVGERIGRGLVKEVHYGTWHDLPVAVNTLTTGDYKDDFHHGLKMIKAFQPHQRITQVVGYCNDTLITEYHPFKSATNLEETLKIPNHQEINNLTTRFQLCLDYVEILEYLHKSPNGTRVMCDSNGLDKVMEQYLITSDIRLVLNDLDALPEVKNGKRIKCGHRELTGDFVAPEQLWPYPEIEFKDDNMPGYNEKIDIWKVPDVCLHFIGENRGTDSLKFHLHKIHQKCKSVDPRFRPTADELHEEYSRVRKYIGLHSYKEL